MSFTDWLTSLPNLLHVEPRRRRRRGFPSSSPSHCILVNEALLLLSSTTLYAPLRLLENHRAVNQRRPLHHLSRIICHWQWEQNKPRLLISKSSMNIPRRVLSSRRVNKDFLLADYQSKLESLYEDNHRFIWQIPFGILGTLKTTTKEEESAWENFAVNGPWLMMLLHIEEAEKKNAVFQLFASIKWGFHFWIAFVVFGRARRQRRLSAFKRKFEIFALFLLLKAISHFILCCKAISYERSTNARSFTR